MVINRCENKIRFDGYTVFYSERRLFTRVIKIA